MIVAMFCYHVYRVMRISDVVLQNALYWLHDYCMGLLLRRKPELVFFRETWLQLAMKGANDSKGVNASVPQAVC